MKRSSRLLIEEPPLQVLPSLAVAIGLNEAVFLQQVHYWAAGPTGHERDGRRWVYNSYPGWQKQFPFWSVATIRRTIENLERMGLLISGNYNTAGMDRTKWYSVNYDAIDALPSAGNSTPSAHIEQTMCAERADQVLNMSAPIPETNTETNNREGTPARPSAQTAYPANSPAVIATGDLSADTEWESVGHAVPKGTPIQLRPDRPAVQPVPKAGDDPALDADWQTLIATFPHRDGAGKVHRPKDTRLAFVLAGPSKRAQILTGARHLAAGSKDAQEGFGPHLLDFIQQETYTLWQTPATPRPLRPTSDPTRPASPPRRLLNPPQATSA